MKVNIVTEPKPGWILRRISEEYQSRISKSYITDMRPIGDADVNLYINYAIMKEKSDKLDVAWFTHKENSDFDKVAEMADLCIAMCDKTANLLPVEKTIVVKPAVSQQFLRSGIKLGCFGREYKSGRKRYDVIDKIREIPRVSVLFSNGSVLWGDMPNYYNAIDYLLVLSNNEGGPMPVLEAMSMGKPVIAPDVGWCWDYPVIKYSSIDDLMGIIKKLVQPTGGWVDSTVKLINAVSSFYERVR